MASFEGKPSTDNHPPDWVTPENFSQYFRGTAQNIRQSKEEPDLLLGDLIIYDLVLIKEIQDGKREVSCGYDCTYVPNDDGSFSQKQIRGNHVAVVKSGRAGDRVAIKDNSIQITNKEGEKKKMADKLRLPVKKHSRVTDILASLGLKHFAIDAEPEEIMDAVTAMAEEKSEGSEDEGMPEKKDSKEEEKSGKEDQTNDSENGLEELTSKVDKLTAIVTQLVEGKKEAKPEDAIDAIIEELETPEKEQGDEEESVTIPVEEMSEDEGLPESETSDPSERPKSPIPNADSTALLRMAKMMKPIIANMADPVAKKKACDSLQAELKRIKKGNGKDGYGIIAQAQRQKAASSQKNTDSKTEQIFKQIEDIKYKFNPHYKKQEGK